MMNTPAGLPAPEDACPLCGGTESTYLFISHGTPVRRCNACGLTRLFPPPTGVQAFYGDLGGRDPASDHLSSPDSATERDANLRYCRLLTESGLSRGAAVLVVAATGHPVSETLETYGFRVVSSLNAQQAERATLDSETYDGVVVIFQLEKTRDPVAFLKRLRAILKPGGQLLVVTPSLDSWPARMLREQWTEWRPENLYYFGQETLQGALLQAGFEHVRMHQDRRRYSLDHVYERAGSFPQTVLTRLLRLGVPRLPHMVRASTRPEVATSGIVAVAQRATGRARPLLSIVMPVFNERASFHRTIERVLAKQIPGIDKEVIIIESNSTDGTRDLVKEYRDHPGVTLILQERPRGKGNAVREGLARATGDIVLIQDADEEYDIQDYDALIQPLLRHERAFVLGSRHTDGWKIRKFNDMAGVAEVFNVGHVLFLLLLNAMYGQRLRDPFTMYKVFWRDCINDIALECDRFDFDFELVIKLIRKGYRPIEIPVNYQARSFREGKKVSLVRDPLTWIRALARYRFGSIYTDGRR